MANTLMFEVGVKEADSQLTELEKRLQKIVSTYGKLELKVQVDGLKAFTSTLENIGQSKGLDALQRRIDVLQSTLANVGMSGAKSMQEFETAVKTTSAVADQYTRRINEMKAARDRFKEGSDAWIRQNNKLMDFQNDKQVLAIYAQEQLAIKNLEEAKTRLGNTNNQEAESFQKIVTTVEMLNNSINTLKATFGSLDPNKSSITQLIEQFEKLRTELSTITRELNNVTQKLNSSSFSFDFGKVTGIGDLNTAIRGLEISINDIIKLFSNLSNAVKLDASSETIKKLQADADAAQKTIAELTEKLNNMATAQNKVAEATAKTGKSEQQIGDSQQAMFNRYQKLLSDIQNLKREIIDIQRGTGGGGPFGSKLGEYYSALNQIRNSVREITSAPSVAEALQRGMNSERLSKLTSALAAIKSDMKDTISESKAFNKGISKDSSQAEASIRKLGMAFNEMKNYMKANGGSEEMKRLQQEIQVAIQKMRQLMNAGDFKGAVNVYERLSGILHQASAATKEFEKSQKGLTSTISATNASLNGQSQILSDLRTMAMQYLSVWGAQSFINNIIELGGQLEQQRLSIGAILQDTAQANHLFGQIKDLAIKSPFGVQQLDAMTKQLSAYGFQYSELYEWTKRLADISAATGTSVDRLALALGHVRSEGALSGYTLRQFSMGNIPLLEKLSKNLGKTKQEIRKMTRNKEIGYEDVLNVLKQLTDEGGMFFEAQETMAQALNAKFKNLRDSFQIMYSEMAEGAPGDFLKRVAEVMTDISKSWRVLMPLVISGGAAFGMWRLATIALNYQLERSGKLLVGNALATSKYSVNQLRAIATTGRLTVALRGLGRALMSIAKFVFNPVTLGFAAVEGLIYLWSKHNDEVRKAKDLTKEFSETAVESQKNIGKQLEEIKPYTDDMDDSVLKTSIESMTESLKNYGINAQKVLNEAFGKDSEGNVMSLAEKYKFLREELEKTKAVYEEMEKTAGAFEYGIRQTSGSWVDENVETDLNQYAEAFKNFEDEITKFSSKYGDVIKNAIDAATKADPAFATATEKMSSYGQKLAEYWENVDKYKKAAEAAAPYLQDAEWRELYYNSSGYINLASKKKEAMRELEQFISTTEDNLKQHGYDFAKGLAPEQVDALLKESKIWLEKHPDWENIYDVIQKKLEKRWPIKFEPDLEPVVEELPEWMQAIQDELDAKKTGIQIKAGMSMEQIIEEARKAYQTAETTINKLGPIAIKAGIRLDGLTDEDVAQYGPMSQNYNPELYNTLLDLKKKQDAKGLIDAFGKKRGLNFKDMKKDGSHKTEKQNQEAAKAVREQVRIIKEAADAFQYWREKVGDKGAWEHVQAEFGDVLAKIGITAQNIEDVRGHLKNISNTKEYKAITDKKIKTEIDKERAKEEDQFIRKDFEKSSEEWSSALNRDIDELTRKWEIFNSVVSETGDRMLAARLSGITPGATPADLKRMNIASFAGVGIDFDSILGMSEKQIDKYVYSLGIVEDKIEAVQNGLKEWKKAQEDLTVSDIQDYAKWLGSLVDLESIRTRNQEEYNRVLEETNRLLAQGIITQEEAERRKAGAETTKETKDWQSTAMYASLYNNSLAMAEGSFYTAYNKESASLYDQMKQNSISIQEYADKMEKLNKIAADFKIDGFLGLKGGVGAYLSGGYQGLIDYHWNKAKEKRANGDEEGAKEEEKRAESMMKAQKTAEQLAKAFQDLSTGADMLANLFDALGMEGASNAMSDTGSVLGGIAGGASSLSALGPYGMAAGAVLGGLTSIAQLHDKGIQREIDALKDHAESLQENTEAIKAARERTLGYDTGKLREAMAQQYKDTQRTISVSFITGGEKSFTVTDEAKKAMQEYYKKNSGKSGYAAELENLKAMREDYIEMYNLEEDKKKSSQDALDEYKSKIAELDDQIMYFVEDLANELWGIDFKSWADQISDALWTAFENGEDALDAFHDAAKDIISDVAKRMMNINLIEPVFSQLEDALFGKIGSNGQRTGGAAYNFTTGQFNEQETLRILGQFFGEDGEFAKVISSAEEFYKMAEKATGFDLSSEDSSRSTSSGIKSITEQTADLLASYVNGIRADVSVDRALLTQYLPEIHLSVTRSSTSLANIENHTAAIMRSNQIVADKITSLDANINGLKNKTWKLPMA